MKKPTCGDGLALTKSPYQIDLFDKVPQPTIKHKKNSIYGPPAIIPGVRSPLSDHEKYIIECVWEHAAKRSKWGVL